MSYDAREKFCPPLRPLDACDHPSVPNAVSAAARAGFGAIPECRVLSFFLSNGQYRAQLRFSKNGASVTLTARTLGELVTDALAIHQSLGQEAA